MRFEYFDSGKGWLLERKVKVLQGRGSLLIQLRSPKKEVDFMLCEKAPVNEDGRMSKTD